MPHEEQGPKSITLQSIKEIVGAYFSPLPRDIEEKILKYLNLLGKWSRQVPLTSLRDPEEIVRFHFGESIFALSMMGTGAGGRLADVATGSGFPGIPLKLANPSLSVSLIEPNKKKCAFLHEVIRLLDLDDTQVVCAPFESAKIGRTSLSVVTSRALGRPAAVLEWAKERLRSDGLAILWLGREDAMSISKSLGWQWQEPALIPGTRQRYILKGLLDI